jgi:DNA polymerase-3 subunit delta
MPVTATSEIFFLYGTDEYAMVQQINKRIREMGPATTADLNITRLDGKTLDMDALQTAANAVPFLSDKRLVILENPSVGFKGPDGLTKLSGILRNLPPTTTVLLIEFLEPQYNRNYAFLNWLKQLISSKGGINNIQTHEFKLPDENQLPGWIINETSRQAQAHQKSVRIEPTAAEHLAEMVGEDTRLASQEIAKLLEYVDYSRPITIQEVDQVSIATAHQDVFVLVDALGKKQGQKAQLVLHQLLEVDEAFSIWGMVVRQFRLLLQAREIMDAGGRKDDIAREIPVHSFVAGKLAEQARQFDLAGLELIYHRLVELDESMKSGQLTIDLALDLLVVELCA